MNLVINIFLWLFFLISSSILVVIAALIRLFTFPFDPNTKILHQFSCFWASLYLWANPFWSLQKFSLENADRNKTYVIVANHQSMVDILVLYNTFLHFKWVSKQEIFYVPFLGWNMWLNGYVGIKRGDPKSRDVCVNKSRNWLKRGSSMLYFPEGTRTRDGVMLPFKIGAFRLAIETNTPILPIAITGSLNALPKKSFLLHRKSHMKLKVLPEISVEHAVGNSIEERSQHLLELTRQSIASAISS